MERNNKAQLTYSFDIALQNERHLKKIQIGERNEWAFMHIVDLQSMRENRTMKKNRIIHFHVLSQSVLLQRKESGAISRGGNIFLMRMETG